MYNGDIGGVSGNNNLRWSKQLAKELDKADGKEDGLISKNIWDGYLRKMGSSGNTVRWAISVENAEKSLEYYQRTKDAGQVCWDKWNEKLEEFKEETGGKTADDENINNYKVQKDESFIGIIKRSLAEQGIENPTQEQLNTAINQFNQMNPGAVKTARNGVKYLLAGADIKLPRGEMETKSLKLLEDLKKYGKEMLTEDETSIDDVIGHSDITESQKQYNPNIDSSIKIWFRNSNIVVDSDSNGNITRIGVLNSGDNDAYLDVVWVKDGVAIDADGIYSDEKCVKRKQTNDLESMLPDWLVENIKNKHYKTPNTQATEESLVVNESQSTTQISQEQEISVPENYTKLLENFFDEDFFLLNNKTVEDFAKYSSLEQVMTDKQKEQADSIYDFFVKNETITSFEDGSLGTVYVKSGFRSTNAESLNNIEPFVKSAINMLVLGKEKYGKLMQYKQGDINLTPQYDKMKQGITQEEWTFVCNYKSMLDAMGLSFGDVCNTGDVEIFRYSGN